MDLFEFKPGDGSLIVSIPHAGTRVPDRLFERLTPEARRLADTDWHLPQLYDFVWDGNATVLAARYSRYVIDLNRAPDNEALYPGRYETRVCPTETFAGAPLYEKGRELHESEIEERLADFWRPYHEALRRELNRVRGLHGFAVLFDAHSICNRLPRMFDGVLPDLNFGTSGGQSCAVDLAARIVAAAKQAGSYSTVLDGRYKGGYITRHYGRPGEGVHAIQLELSQDTYMNQFYPFEFSDEKARHVRPTLQRILAVLGSARPSS